MKILVIQYDLGTGGVERSLINFLNEIDYNKHTVDLYLYNWSGEMLKSINPNVICINRDVGSLNNDCESDKKQKLMTRLRAFAFKYIPFLWKYKFAHYDNVFKNIHFNEHYDIAIVYHGLYTNLLYLLADKVNADQKIAICHGDFAFVNTNKKMMVKLWERLDTLLFVSKSCEDKFKLMSPNAKVKTGYFYNPQNYEQILSKSETEEQMFDENKFNIVSVSRLSEEKAYFRTLKVLHKIHKNGYQFHYHIIGGGKLQKDIEEYVVKHKMKDYVTIYGNKNNPYPYIKSADLFYLGSYNEAAPMVLAEAMCLGTPIISTDTCSAKEILKDYGIVVDNNKKAIYNGLLCAIKGCNKSKKDPKFFNENDKHSLINYLNLR